MRCSIGGAEHPEHTSPNYNLLSKFKLIMISDARRPTEISNATIFSGALHQAAYATLFAAPPLSESWTDEEERLPHFTNKSNASLSSLAMSL